MPVTEADPATDLANARAYTDIPLFQPEDSPEAGFVRDPRTYFMKPYRELGPIFRMRFRGEEVVCLGGREANKAVWKHHDWWDYYRTNRIFREQFSDRYLNQLEGGPYRKKRRRTTMGFKPSVIMQHTGGMSRILYTEIDKLGGAPADIRPLCMRLVINMTGRVLLQEDLPAGMDEAMATSNKEMLKASSLGWKRWLWYMYPPKVLRRQKIFAYLNEVLDRREKQPPEQEDILSLILAAHPVDEPPIPRYELVHDLSQMFMGGSTTSAMLICWSLLQTYLDRDWLAEVRAELDEHWNPDDFRRMSTFPKLRATLLEAERLRPPVPIFPRFAARTFAYNGYTVPEGIQVVHLHTLCHFMEEEYDQPLEFRPQRFLQDENLPHREVHGTYGGGQHVCVGQNLARIQPPVAVADILHRFDLEFPDGPPSLRDRYDVVLAPVENPVRVRFVPRKR
ncbi:MAG: cytochrome P450 [Opitutales bacterium]